MLLRIRNSVTINSILFPIVHPVIGWLKISISSQIISAIPSRMFLGVCDEILINFNPIGVFPTVLMAHKKFQDP